MSALDQVVQFLSDHNRPFTTNDILQGLGQTPKTQVVSALTKLVSQKLVIEKLCGKQKVYCIAQKQSLPLKELTNGALELERECSSLAVKLKDIEGQLETKQCELKRLEGVVSEEEALERKKRLEEEIEEMQSKLGASQGDYDKCEREKIERNYRNVLKEYNKRKRLCMDMVEAIFENYPKKKKDLLQEMGIETDEDAGFSVKVK